MEAEIFQTNPRLRSLLIILIFTFAASGIALAVLAQIQAYHREQIYLATEAALPRHKVVGSENDNTACQALPKEIADSSIFKAWVAKEKVNGSFCKSTEGQIKIDVQNPLVGAEEKQCQEDARTYSGGLFLPSPNKSKSICMGNFGEPDSLVLLNDKAAGSQKRLKYCGTPCSFQSGFWLDDDRFVLLETDNIDGYSLEYLISMFDFKNNIQQAWKVASLSISLGTTLSETEGWKTYRNQEHGFELEYPDKYKIQEYDPFEGGYTVQFFVGIDRGGLRSARNRGLM